MIFPAFSRVNGQKIAKTKNENYIHHKQYVRDNIAQWLFYFFENLISWVIMGRTRREGVKVQKIVQKDKKFFLLCSISQKPYIINDCHLWCKSLKWYPGAFFIFSKFWFFVLLRKMGGGGGGGKRQRIINNYPKPMITNFSLSHYISRTVDHIKIFGTQV